MCMLLDLHYAKFDVCRLFCSKVIEEQHLECWLDSPLGKGRVKITYYNMTLIYETWRESQYVAISMNSQL